MAKDFKTNRRMGNAFQASDPHRIHKYRSISPSWPTQSANEITTRNIVWVTGFQVQDNMINP